MKPQRIGKIIIASAIVVYCIAAIYNTGYYYFDEHYQIIEFAELKLGRNTSQDLAWEYAAQIRPSIQPAIVYVIFSVIRAFGFDSPYLLATSLRLFSAIFALMVITYFNKRTAHLVADDLLIWYQLLSYFLWFLPFVNVRCSSESYAGLLFLLAVAVYHDKFKTKHLLTGALLGLAFLFRFQSAFMSAGFILWLLIIEKMAWRQFALMITGGVVVLCFGWLIDLWFYESSTVTFINYYIANVIDNVASKFGVSPWYAYFLDAVSASILPIGLLIWSSLLIQLIFNKKGFAVWIIIPFLAAHMLTPHKELRFLFPLINFIPLVIILTIQFLNEHQPALKRSWVLKAVASLVVVTNLLGLLVSIFSPADSQGKMNITKAIHESYHDQNVKLWIKDVTNPYKPLFIKQNFYLDKNVTISELDLSSRYHFDNAATNLLVIPATDQKVFEHLLKPYHLTTVKQGIPPWIRYIKNISGYEDNAIALFEVSR